MELVARKADLVRELQFFQQIVERKNTIPILANVLLESTQNGLTLLATDLEVALRSRCEAAVDRAGAVTLPAKKLYEVVRALPETDVRLETEKNGTGVKVSAERFESRMPTLPREDFPSLPDSVGASRSTIKGGVLREMVAKTQFAITGEDTRYYLNGALFVLRGDSMTLVATDGHRLALVTAAREPVVEGVDEIKAILPRKTLAELSRLLVDDSDLVYERGENHLFFEIGPRLLISRMIDGQFPAYEKVIPRGNDKRIEFERDRLTSALRRVAILSNERSRAVKFVIEPGKVDVTSSSAEFGEAREPLAVDYTGEGLTICFNAQYLQDFLNVVACDVVALELKDDVSQAVMRPVGVEGYDYTYVIMPMRV
ncbi:MAG: DNA polymerase III subunit beta [Acidobacteriota bacterium]